MEDILAAALEASAGNSAERSNDSKSPAGK